MARPPLPLGTPGQINTVLPALGALRLRECTVARLDTFLEALEPRYAASARRTLRSIVSGVLQIAVLHEALAANPVRELDRIEQPKGQAKKKPAADRRRAPGAAQLVRAELGRRSRPTSPASRKVG